MDNTNIEVINLKSFLTDLAYAASTPDKATYAIAVAGDFLSFEGMFRFHDQRPTPITDPLQLIAVWDIHNATDDVLNQIAKMVYDDDWFKYSHKSEFTDVFTCYLNAFARRLGSLEHARYVDYALSLGHSLGFDGTFSEDVTNFMLGVCDLCDILITEIEKRKQEHLKKEAK